MGAGASNIITKDSFPKSITDALDKGYSQSDIDMYVASKFTRDLLAAANAKAAATAAKTSIDEGKTSSTNSTTSNSSTAASSSSKTSSGKSSE